MTKQIRQKGNNSNQKTVVITAKPVQENKRALSKSRKFEVTTSVKKRVREEHKKQLKEKKGLKLAALARSMPDETVTTPPQTLYQPSPAGIQHFIECFLHYMYKRTDLAYTPYPIFHGYYLWYVALLHIKRVGQLIGTLGNALPPTSPGQTYAVPFAFAKYLEGLSPYKKRMDLSPAFSINTTFFGAPEPGVVGIGPFSAVFPRGTQYPNWALCYMINDPTDVSDLTNPPSNKVSVWGSFARWKTNLDSTIYPTGSLPTFTEWVSSGANVQGISDTFQKKCSCIPLQRIPKTSPDTSAMALCAESPMGNQTSFSGGVCGPNRKFDPELAPMYNPDTAGSNPYHSTGRKSMVPPIFVPQGAYQNYYSQVAFTLIWLMMHQDRYVPGPAKKVALFCKKRVSTFYIQPHYVSGYGLSQAVAADYKQLIANKAAGSPNVAIDPNYVNFNNMLGIAQAALQKRINDTAICYMADPPVYFQDSDFPDITQLLVPQVTYCDQGWGSVSLPVNVVNFIESVGVVMLKDGTLRAPQANYNNLITSNNTNGSVMGAYNNAVFGFSGAEDAYFGIPNPYTTASVNTVAPNYSTTDTPPYLLLNAVDFGKGGIWDNISANQTDGIYLYYADVQFNYGDDPAGNNTVNWNTLTANGTSEQTFLDVYKAFLSYESTTNTIPTATVTANVLGSFPAMTSAINYSPQVGSAVPLISPGYVNNPERPASAAANGGPSVSSVPVQSILSEVPLNRDDVLTVLTGGAEEGNASQTGTTPSVLLFAKKKSSYLRDPVAIDPPVTASIGPYSGDPPDSSGTFPIFSGLSQKFATPNSTFAQVMQDFASKHCASNLPPPPLRVIAKPHRINNARQATLGMPVIQDPVNYHGTRLGTIAADQPNVKGKTHRLLKAAKGVFHAADSAVKDVGDNFEKATKFLEAPALMSLAL